MSKELSVAIKAAKKAGRILLSRFHEEHSIEMKTQYDFVTEADKESEKSIIETLNRSFPNHSILSEEAGGINKKSEYLWMVDPLDGTTNYSIKNPFFNVSIALTKCQEIVLGVVYAPFTKELFWTEKDKGAFLNGKKIKVSEEAKLKNLLLVYCHANNRKDIQRSMKVFKKLKPITRDFNRMRAGALELAFVAAGRLGSYISCGYGTWDLAAGTLLVKEAGGKVTDFSGKEWNISKKDIIASNGKIHGKLVKLLRTI